jgi:hypothetical protein
MKVLVSLAAVPLSVARPYLKGWNRNGLGVRVVNRMNKDSANSKYRIYLPISKPKVKVKALPSIAQAIKEAGYKIENYVLGVAVNKDGRQIKIGKILPDKLKANICE